MHNLKTAVGVYLSATVTTVFAVDKLYPFMMPPLSC
jgi:hypothetical protein